MNLRKLFKHKPKLSTERRVKVTQLVKDLAEFQNARLQQMTPADPGFYGLHKSLMKTLGVLSEYIKAGGRALGGK